MSPRAMRTLRRLAAIVTLLCGAAASARENVTFVLADDNPGHAFFAAARDYYAARRDEAGVLVTTARSLADVREFLQRSPLRGSEPWGDVRLIAHGSQWQGLRVPLFAHGELASLTVIERALATQEFPPLVESVLDRDSRFVIESCGLARRPLWLQRFGRLFTQDGRTPVLANTGYVWFRRVRDEAGVSQAVREELPYRADVIAGHAAVDATVQQRLQREWPRTQVQLISVPVRIDVPEPDASDAAGVRPHRSPDALAALRNYGLRWSQFAWRREHGRLRGEALIVVAAPDPVAADLQRLALVD